MLRRVLIAFGVFEIMAPSVIIEACERIGLENPDEARLRPHALSLARLEGLLVTWVLLRGRRDSPVISSLLAIAGFLAVLHPHPLIRLSQHVAYENTTDLQLRPWVVPAARALGALYLLVVFLSETPGDTEN